MAEHKTKMEDLNDDSSNSGELTESEAAKIAGGLAQSQRLKLGEDTIIDTVHPAPAPPTHDVKQHDEADTNP